MRDDPKLKEIEEDLGYWALEEAKTGDFSRIAHRLRLDMLSDGERQFLADYLIGKVKPRKLKGGRSMFKRDSDITALDKGTMVQMVIALTAADHKVEWAVAKMCEVFHVKRSYVFKLLRDADPKLLASMRAHRHE